MDPEVDLRPSPESLRVEGPAIHSGLDSGRFEGFIHEAFPLLSEGLDFNPS